MDAYTNALPAALACDPGAADQCQQLASTDSLCSCGRLVQDASELDAIVTQMVTEGCIHQAACPCPIVPLVTCLPTDGGRGACGPDGLSPVSSRAKLAAEMDDDGYLLDNRAVEAGDRITALSALFDPPTFRHVDALGIARGWRCWEVGAGGPSVPRGLAARVGFEGYVLATDLEVSPVLAAAGGGPIEVRRHDVAHDPAPEGPFDLVHARLVLVHLPDRERALAAMVGALRPGGWLLVEDADPALQPLAVIDPAGPEAALANKLRAAFRVLLAERKVDLAYGRTLPRVLRAAGLSDVAADAYFPVALPACRPLEIATVTFLRDQLLAKGLATAEEIDRHLGNVGAGRVDLAQPPMISAWGRRP